MAAKKSEKKVVEAAVAVDSSTVKAAPAKAAAGRTPKADGTPAKRSRRA